MHERPPGLRSWILVLAAVVAGCAAGPEPEPQPAPPAGSPPTAGTLPTPTADGFTRIVAGAGDSVSALPGTPGAGYRYRFRMIEPGNERNAFQDRELSFYFKPSPTSIYFQVENRQNRPVTIDWDKSVFFGPNGQQSKAAHGATRWVDRFSPQAPTIIPGLQRYGDYVFGMSYLVDPAGSDQQLHYALLPEDAQAIQFTDRVFGMNLVFTVEDRERVYAIRFKVDSVIPQ